MQFGVLPKIKYKWYKKVKAGLPLDREIYSSCNIHCKYQLNWHHITVFKKHSEWQLFSKIIIKKNCLITP